MLRVRVLGTFLAAVLATACGSGDDAPSATTSADAADERATCRGLFPDRDSSIMYALFDFMEDPRAYPAADDREPFRVSVDQLREQFIPMAPASMKSVLIAIGDEAAKVIVTIDNGGSGFDTTAFGTNFDRLVAFCRERDAGQVNG